MICKNFRSTFLILLPIFAHICISCHATSALLHFCRNPIIIRGACAIFLCSTVFSSYIRLSLTLLALPYRPSVCTFVRNYVSWQWQRAFYFILYKKIWVVFTYHWQQQKYIDCHNKAQHIFNALQHCIYVLHCFRNSVFNYHYFSYYFNGAIKNCLTWSIQCKGTVDSRATGCKKFSSCKCYISEKIRYEVPSLQKVWIG